MQCCPGICVYATYPKAREHNEPTALLQQRDLRRHGIGSVCIREVTRGTSIALPAFAVGLAAGGCALARAARAQLNSTQLNVIY